MSLVAPILPHSAKTCPHGLPGGACPVCSGMGGGGGSKKIEKPKPENEMSYSQCYSIWMRMKAEKADKLAQTEALQRQMLLLDKMKEALSKVSDKLLNSLDKIQKMLPPQVQEIFSKFVSNIIKPLLTLIENFPKAIKNIQEFIQNVQRMAYVVAEKLAAVFGEIKNFIKKKLSDNFKKFTKKIYRMLNLFGLMGEEFDEENNMSTELATFKTEDIKTIKELLITIFNSNEREYKNARED